MERQPPIAAVETARGLVEPGQVGSYIFGRRTRVGINSWNPQDPWLSTILAAPQSEKREGGQTIFSTSEVSLEHVSLNSGPAVLELTDDEAQQIMESFGGDAFPPQ
jgi:hypothetical protein